MLKDGLLLIDKPANFTSHDVIDQLRRHLRLRHIGHAGTLDPIATGLLVCLVGHATKLSPYIIGHRKHYLVEAVFGEMRDTYDRAGTIIDRCMKNITHDELIAAVENFPRSYEQLPPPFSAKKINGRPAHKQARAGETPELKPKTVEIFSFALDAFDFPRARFTLEVSAGTYVRSLVVDLAKQLDTFAYVNELRRTAVGAFRVEDATPLDDFLQLAREEAAARLIPMERALPELTTIELDRRGEVAFTNGRRMPHPGPDETVTVHAEGRFLGIGKVQDNQLRPVRVIHR